MNAQPELVPCLYCGRLISPGRNRKRKFCNVAEKQAAYNERKKAQAALAADEFTVNSDVTKQNVTA